VLVLGGEGNRIGRDRCCACFVLDQEIDCSSKRGNRRTGAK